VQVRCRRLALSQRVSQTAIGVPLYNVTTLSRAELIGWIVDYALVGVAEPSTNAARKTAATIVFHIIRIEIASSLPRTHRTAHTLPLPRAHSCMSIDD
jgi:hypothetical protein